MKVRFAQAVALQAIGPLLLLGLSAAISRLLGPMEQGSFISVKSWLDVLVAIGCFGFPQSAVIAVNRFQVSRSRLYIAAALYSLILFPILGAVCQIFGSNITHSIAWSLLLAVGASCIVVVNIWRGILLTFDDGFRFHLITALPSIALVTTTGFSLLLREPLGQSMVYVCAISGVITLGVGYTIFGWGEARTHEGKEIKFVPLFTNGADVFVQALTSTLQSYLCFAWLRHSEGLSSAGYFSIAIIAMNAFGFPLQAIAPMVLNRWSRLGRDHALRTGGVATLKIVGCVGIAAGVAVSLTPWLTPLALGSAFEGAITAIQIMFMTIVPMTFLRIGSLRLASIGEFRFNSMVAASRCILFLSLLYPLGRILVGQQAATSAAICWLLAESYAAIVTSRKVRGMKRISKIENLA